MANMVAQLESALVRNRKAQECAGKSVYIALLELAEGSTPESQAKVKAARRGLAELVEVETELLHRLDYLKAQEEIA